jgi:hypothetical protein
VSSLADRFTAALLRDPDRGREALGLLRERWGRDAHLQNALHSTLLTRPTFLTAEERDGLQRDLSALVDLLLDLPERMFDGDVVEMCRSAGLDADQRAAVEATWRDREVVLSRADLLRDEQGFKAIEINVHSSLGGIDSGPWHRAFAGLPVFEEFFADQGLGYVDPMDGVAATLRAAAERRGLGPRPSVAIVDWPTSYPALADRLERVAGLLEGHGFSAFACHAGELELRDGRLVRGDRPIDILYRIFLLDDIPQAPELLEPILAAHRGGSLLLAMGFAAELAGNKATLALLSDGVERGRFSPHERALVRRVVPWTRLTRRGPTSWRGLEVDLFELALREQHRLVLKPAGGHAGHGVLLGWTASPSEWREGLERAMGGFWVLQARVHPLAERMPVIEDERGGLDFEDVDVNWGVFAMGGRYGGTMLRAVPRARGGMICVSNDAAVGCCYCAPEVTAA